MRLICLTWSGLIRPPEAAAAEEWGLAANSSFGLWEMIQLSVLQLLALVTCFRYARTRRFEGLSQEDCLSHSGDHNLVTQIHVVKKLLTAFGTASYTSHCSLRPVGLESGRCGTAQPPQQSTKQSTDNPCTTPHNLLIYCLLMRSWPSESDTCSSRRPPPLLSLLEPGDLSTLFML